MDKMLAYILGIAIILTNVISAQSDPVNAGTDVAPHLLECYNNTEYMYAYGRLPATMTTLINLIKKIEAANPNMDARQISLFLLQIYKQDGIKYRPNYTGFGIPYSPSGKEAPNNKILLTEMLPTAQTQLFSNKTITPLEKCSLHFMISGIVDPWIKGDTDYECSQFGKYTKRNKRQNEYAEKLEVLPSDKRSQCPTEFGVVYSPWGTVAAGKVLAAIATVYNKESVPEKYDTVYASTLVGDLSEVVLYQSSKDLAIGDQGNWNSTLNPKYYFLVSNKGHETTNAEIRGDLDGIYIAKTIDAKKDKSTLKVSEILRSYYSEGGLYNSSIRACNRQFIETSMINSEDLKKEIVLYLPVLNKRATTGQTLPPDTYELLADTVVNKFNDVIASVLSTDQQCNNDVTELPTVGAADLIIFIDSSWPFETISTAISYYLENINVAFGSTYRILNGRGDTIVNQTSFLGDFYVNYNWTTHETNTGMDYSRVFQEIENISKDRLSNETITGGQSTVALIVSKTAPTAEAQTLSRQRRDVFKTILPDLKLMVLGAGSAESYSAISDLPNTVFIIDETITNEGSAKQVIDQLIAKTNTLPRNIVNPKCESGFSSGIPTSTFELLQSVEPNSVNYYRIAPNYFKNANSDAALKVINPSVVGSLTVCMSRTQEQPYQNSTDGDTVCNTQDSSSFNIHDACGSQSVQSCNPIYLSVQAKRTSASTRCTDKVCTTVDSVKYSIRMENVGCSGAVSIVGSVLFIMSLVIASFKLS